MNNKKFLALRLATLTPIALAVGVAHAQEQAQSRPLVYTLGQSFMADSNLFRLPDGAAVPAVYGSGGRSDTISRTYGAISYDNVISKQQVSARLDVDLRHFSHYSALNRNTYALSGSWSGDIGRAVYGAADLSFSRTATDFFDQTGFSANLIKGMHLGGTLGYRFTPSWSALARVDFTNRDNTAATLSTANIHSRAVEFGGRFEPGSGFWAELMARQRKVDFPNPVVYLTGAGLQTVSNSFTSNQIVARASYQASGISSLTGQLGLTNLRFDQLTQRNTHGYTLGATYRHLYSEALNFGAQLSRDVANDQVSFSSPVTITRFGLDATWRPTGRITVNANQTFTRRNFEADPAVIAGVSKLDADRLTAFNLNARYQLLRTVYLTAGLTRQSRDAALPSVAYNGTVANVGVEMRID